ncbi:hypothetical protein JAAARDRAFT_172360 [Jaapia argillacea MUCL 33604]|uniref:Fungal lipase-type domain-containing protein n=1 Tax=Jaapia argillacea MUCL 33604 TaxID=933084 RepID=A0A067Q706_9AGAM|nr:hypothetical protein JAAARDRAFT_172360 [Jaapia argillacea MUCL 33604]
MISGRVFLALALGALSAQAIPSLKPRQSISTLSTTQIDTYTPYTWYASAAYCAPANTLAWNCGTNCQANPTFEPVASGGDGDETQYWYVGYDPTLETIIVAHQGTNPSEFLSLLTDGEIVYSSLDPTLFPGVPSSVEAHDGFQATQSRSAPGVLAGVQSAIATYGATQVTVTGHSLGAAIALLDSIYLPLHLPSDIHVKFIGYGLPRVGNQDFANYVDANAANVPVTHINNEEDPIPICPGMFLGYVHPSGEIHIQDSGSWDACPGQDNESDLCIVGDVPEIWDGDISNHDGPYNGVTMGC